MRNLLRAYGNRDGISKGNNPMPRTLRVVALSILLHLGAFCGLSFAEKATVTDKEWEAFDAALDREDWKAVEKAATEYLARLKGDERPPAGYFRLMMIHAWAGQVVEGQLSFDTLGKRLEALIGKPLMTGQAKILASKEVAYGSLQTSEQSDRRVICAMANNKATAIHSYIEAELLLPLDTKILEGKRGALTGTLSSFELSPNRSLWRIVTLHLKDAAVLIAPDDMK